MLRVANSIFWQRWRQALFLYEVNEGGQHKTKSDEFSAISSVVGKWSEKVGKLRIESTNWLSKHLIGTKHV